MKIALAIRSTKHARRNAGARLKLLLQEPRLVDIHHDSVHLAIAVVDDGLQWNYGKMRRVILSQKHPKHGTTSIVKPRFLGGQLRGHKASIESFVTKHRDVDSNGHCSLLQVTTNAAMSVAFVDENPRLALQSVMGGVLLNRSGNAMADDIHGDGQTGGCGARVQSRLENTWQRILNLQLVHR